MFKIEKFGFSLTLPNGSKVEADFGPMSRSENTNISKQAFAHIGEGRTAEIRVFADGTATPSASYFNVEAGEFVNILDRVATG